MRLYIVAGKETDSVTYGFLPAAAALGLDVSLLTDRAWPMETVRCDVTDFRSIIAAVARDAAPAAIFTNSDHLQAPTALAAAYFGLPAKDWRAALHTKNKALMRRELGGVYAVELRPGDKPPGDAPYPVVVKPREGVASEDVFLAGDVAELAARCGEIWARRPEALVAEEYLPGELHTLETLNGQVLGGFHTTLSAPPHFVEERLDWVTPPPCADEVLAGLRTLGVGLGACHTEYVVHEGRARIVEVNYRIIGDHCDFLLGELLGVPIFEWVLRAHLGEALPPLPSAPARHATVDSVIAERSGTLATAPGREEYETGGVRLAYWPVRTAGDTVELTHTNRDYLGMIRAVGSDAAGVEAAIRAFRARHTWEIVP